MKGFGVATALAAASIFAKTVLADVDPIVIKGSKFVYKTNGTQMYVDHPLKGIEQALTVNEATCAVLHTNRM